jgi:hypothetical protein
MFLGSAIARADTITILDATDHGGPIIVITTDPARTLITQEPFGTGGPDITLLAPSPTASFVSQDCPLGQLGCSHLNIGEFPITSDPFGDFESDIFKAFSPSSSTYEIQIIEQTTFPCFAETACLVREDGLLHTLDTITWSDGTIDTVRFRYVPEPASLLLLGTGLFALGLAPVLRRGWRTLGLGFLNRARAYTRH